MDNFTRRPTAVLFALVLAVAGCGRSPDDASPKVAPTAEHKLAVQPWLPLPEIEATQLAAGERLEVRCRTAVAPDGSVAPPLEPRLEPAMRRVRSDAFGHAYAAERVGTYAVRCGSSDGRAVGGAVTVHVAPGAPVAVAVVLEPTEVGAGEPAVARCIGLDAAGNHVAPPGSDTTVVGTRAAPPAALATGGTLTAARFLSSAPLQMRAQDGRTLEIRTDASGEVTLRCAVPAWPALPTSRPVTLRVTPAAAAAVVAEAAPGPHRSGASVAVRCRVRDVHGNVVDAPGEPVAEGPGPVTSVPGGLRAQVAGAYAVRCRVAPAAGGPTLTSAPTPVTVVPGPPSRWKVNLYRQGRCFSHRKRLPLTWTAWDDANNRIDDVQAALETDPPTLVQRDDSEGFIFTEEGSYDVVLRPLGEAAGRLQPWSEHIIVDSTPPRLELLRPARGAMLKTHEATQMLVGRVADPVSPLVSLVINGVAQPLVPGAREHAFEVPFESPWGLSVVRATAEDACGNVATLRQSFLRSASYGPATDAADPAARVAQAARAAVAQPLWDDGDPTGGHDISNLLQRAMAGGGLDERLPEHLATFTLAGRSRPPLKTVNHRCLGWETDHKEDGLEVVRTGKLRMGEPAIEFLHVEEGGVHLAVRFTDLYLPLAATLYGGLPCGPAVHPTTKATLHARAVRIEVRASVAMDGEHVKVALCPSCAHADFDGHPPELLFNDPEHPGAAGPLLSPRLANWALRGTSAGLRTALEQRVREDVVREAERLLTGLHIDHALPLPAPLKGNASVLSGIDGITLRGGALGGGTSEVSLYTQVVAPLTKEVRRAESPVPLPPLRGPIRQEARVPLQLQLGDSETFAVAVRDDMLNQMLWSLWASGAFDHVDVHEIMKSSATTELNLLNAMDVKLTFTSPPVVMPAQADGQVKIGVGDVFVELEGDLPAVFGGVTPPGRQHLKAQAYVSSLATARLGVDAAQRKLRVDFLDAPAIDLQVVKIAEPRLMPAVGHTVHKYIAKSMLGMLVQPLAAFPLTKLQIGRLPGIPKDAIWTLDEAEVVRPAGAQEFIMRGRLSTLPEVLFEADAEP